MLEKPITLCQHSLKRPRREETSTEWWGGHSCRTSLPRDRVQVGGSDKEPQACDCKRDILNLENPQGEEREENEVKIGRAHV